jgi:DNA-binding transcriptional MerR regulator
MADYRISELAERTGFAASTLRYYEQVGLLPVERATNGYRTYTDTQLVRLQFIGRAKRLGLSLDDIRDLVRIWDEGSCAGVKARLGELIATRSGDIATRITELTAFDVELGHARVALSGPTPAGACDDSCGCTRLADQPAVLPPTIGCMLSTDERTARGDEWAALLRQATSRVALDDGVDITFQATADLTGRIAELAAREQQCCSFFEFTLDIAVGGRVTLRVRAPQEAQPMLIGLFGSGAVADRGREIDPLEATA